MDTLFAPTEEIESLKARVRELETEVEELKADVEARGTTISELDDKIEALEGELEEVTSSVLRGQVQGLAKVRGCLFAGRHDEGRERLERVLDETGEPWRLWQ